jgi:amino-acid N-acetyltransferase
MTDADRPTRPEIIIRGAVVDDLAMIESLIFPFVELGRLLPRTKEELHDLLPRGFVAVLQREHHEDHIIGFAALEVYSRKLSEIRSLVVADGYRGMGIGRQLVEACLKLAELTNVFEVMVITSEDGFFQRCGFDFTLPGEKKALFYQTRERP